MSQNAGAMYGAQLALNLLPLVVLPWLARALGPAEFGLVVFVQAMGSLVGIVVGFGFNLSGTREIARSREDPESMARAVAAVLSGQLLLATLAAAASLVALAAIPAFRTDPLLPLLGWAMGVLQGLNPTWFLLGIERLRMQALVEVSVRTLQAIAIVAFVRDETDGVLVLMIWLVGNGVVTAVLAAMVLRRVPLRAPRWRAGINAITSGWPLFVTASSVSLYTSGTVFVLGLLVSNAQLAIFAAAERIARAALRLSQPLGAVTYPRVNYLVSSGEERRAQRLALLTVAALGGLGLLGALTTIVLAPWVVDILLGDEFSGSAHILRILILLVPLFALSATLSQHWLLAHGRDSHSLRISIGGGLVTLLVSIAAAATTGIVGVAWALVGVQAGVVAVLAWVVRREGIGPWRASLPAR